MGWSAMQKVGSCLQCLLLATAIFIGCSKTQSEISTKTDTNRMAKDSGTSQGELDDRLIGEWEHVFNEDDVYPAGKESIYPPGTISVIRFGADGVQIATSFFPNGEEKQLKRRWRVEYTFPNTRDSFQLKRQDLDSSSPAAEVWILDVVHFVDTDSITLQSPVDIQPFVYTRRLVSEVTSRTKR